MKREREDSQADLNLLVQFYAAYQVPAGWKPPMIVDTLQEALDHLQIARSAFRLAVSAAIERAVSSIAATTNRPRA